MKVMQAREDINLSIVNMRGLSRGSSSSDTSVLVEKQITEQEQEEALRSAQELRRLQKDPRLTNDLASEISALTNNVNELTKTLVKVLEIDKIKDEEIAAIKVMLNTLSNDFKISGRNLSTFVSNALVDYENRRKISEIQTNQMVEFRDVIIQTLRAEGIEVPYSERRAMQSNSLRQDDVWIGVYLSLLIINLILWMRSVRLFTFSFFTSIIIVFLKAVRPGWRVSWVLTRGFSFSLVLFTVWMTILFIKFKFFKVEEGDNIIY